MSAELKSCPFCGSDNLGISDKTTTISWKRKRYVCIYCKDCNCYGSRTISEEDKSINNKATKESIEESISKWNTRVDSFK